MISRIDADSGRMAALGAILVVFGGVFKAGWKLKIAATGQDVVWTADSLFVLLGPGFTLLAWALWSTRRVTAGKEIPKLVWLRPLAVILLFGIGVLAAATQGGRT